MQLIDEIVAEHALIDPVLGSLRAFAEARVQGGADPSDGQGFVRFFRIFAGHYHHGREEEILFEALVQKAEAPVDRGPIAAMLSDHARLAGLLDQLEPLLVNETLEPTDSGRMQNLALAYSHALWHHIDAENSVLLPEGESRLRRHHVLELPCRSMTPEEAQARAQGERLLAKYPPLYDRDVLRGDGCVHCPAFGETCRGLEREWWNEWEWDEFEDHMPRD